MRMFLPSAAVAELLGLPSPAAFLARRDTMEGEQLFPLPMPHSRRPLLWKADEVQAWIDRNGRPLPQSIDPDLLASGKVALIATGRAALHEMARTA